MQSRHSTVLTSCFHLFIVQQQRHHLLGFESVRLEVSTRDHHLLDLRGLGGKGYYITKDRMGVIVHMCNMKHEKGYMCSQEVYIWCLPAHHKKRDSRLINMSGAVFLPRSSPWPSAGSSPRWYPSRPAGTPSPAWSGPDGGPCPLPTRRATILCSNDPALVQCHSDTGQCTQNGRSA